MIYFLNINFNFIDFGEIFKFDDYDDDVFQMIMEGISFGDYLFILSWILLEKLLVIEVISLF